MQYSLTSLLVLYIRINTSFIFNIPLVMQANTVQFFLFLNYLGSSRPLLLSAHSKAVLSPLMSPFSVMTHTPEPTPALSFRAWQSSTKTRTHIQVPFLNACSQLTQTWLPKRLLSLYYPHSSKSNGMGSKGRSTRNLFGDLIKMPRERISRGQCRSSCQLG